MTGLWLSASGAHPLNWQPPLHSESARARCYPYWQGPQRYIIGVQRNPKSDFSPTDMEVELLNH